MKFFAMLPETSQFIATFFKGTELLDFVASILA